VCLFVIVGGGGGNLALDGDGDARIEVGIPPPGVRGGLEYVMGAAPNVRGVLQVRGVVGGGFSDSISSKNLSSSSSCNRPDILLSAWLRRSFACISSFDKFERDGAK
jgi:hypothetical protein